MIRSVDAVATSSMCVPNLVRHGAMRDAVPAENTPFSPSGIASMPDSCEWNGGIICQKFTMGELLAGEKFSTTFSGASASFRGTPVGVVVSCGGTVHDRGERESCSPVALGRRGGDGGDVTASYDRP